VCFFFVAVLALHPSEYMCPEGPGTPSCWDPAAPHFFKMPVLMLILITVLNDGTLCTIAYDYVVPSAEPEKWNLPVLWIVSFSLAMVAMASSLLLLWAGLDSNNPDGIFHKFGLPRMYFAQIITMMYLKVGGGGVTLHQQQRL
jgi:H+-transporting ATPase